MNQWNDHTFVICAYGDSPFLEDCIKSLLSQIVKSNIILYTSTPSEFIESICQKYAVSLNTSVGGGIGKDWNNALSFVATQYATIAHQDDYYEPTYLMEIQKRITKHKDAIILYSDYFEEKNGEVIKPTSNLKIKSFMLKTISLFPKTKWWRNRILAFGNPICCPAVTYNLELVKGFRFDEEWRVSLDWLAWYHLAKFDGRFVYVPKKLMCHRIHEDSETSNTISDNTRTKEDYMMFNLFWPKGLAKCLNRFYKKSQNTNG